MDSYNWSEILAKEEERKGARTVHGESKWHVMDRFMGASLQVTALIVECFNQVQEATPLHFLFGKVL